MTASRVLRWGLRGLGALVVLGVAAVTVVWLASTKVGPVPPSAPGHHVAQIAAPHRDGPLTLHLWYPAAADVPVTLIGQNALFYGFHGRIDAQGDGQSHPVVLISHGSGGNALRLGWIAAALAARGMIVAAVNHPGTTSGDSLPSRTVQPWERTADLSAILDHLATAPPPGVRPDMTRVGVMGFSLGGATALLVAGARLSKAAYLDHCARFAGQLDCGWLTSNGLDLTTIDAARYEAPMRDPRVKVAVAVDPALVNAMTDDSLAALDLPVLLVNLGAADVSPAAIRADARAALIPGATYRAVDGAAHFSFLARCSAFGVFMIGVAGDDNICSDRGLRDRAGVQDELSLQIGDFLAGGLALR